MVAEEPVEILTADLTVSKDYGGRQNGLARIESSLAEVLSDLVGRESIPVTSHFFYDLGANSLVMAHFCARVRKRADLPSVSMKDIYSYPTISSLAAALEPTPGEAVSPVVSVAPSPPTGPAPVSTARYVLCGALQVLVFLAYTVIATPVFIKGFTWVLAAPRLVDVYGRAVLAGTALFVALTVLPIAAKWILIGRWKPTEFPAWSLRYFRFWVVRALMHTSPMILMVGNPLYVLYLRALGAHIGKGVTILSRTAPVCTDLLTIGAGTVVRKDSSFQCYRAYDGAIQTGPVTLGRDVYVGEHTALDIDTSMGDGAQLGHVSSLQPGQAVPAGQTWHGSPAEPADVNYVRVPPAKSGTVRRARYGLLALLQGFFVYFPLAVIAVDLLSKLMPSLGAALDDTVAAPTWLAIVLDALVWSLVLFLGGLVVGLVLMLTVPRLLNLLVKPDRVYRLYGFHYAVQRLIARMTNIKTFKWLLGDSSYIVPYLRALGYDLSRVEQTGSNFGTVVKHETPYLSFVGTGTMVADGLSIMNADFSSTSFRVTQASIGPGNFVGNQVAYPAGGRTGANCLLATKVMVPLDGKVREGVGLLGSPSFEIPRSVDRDSRFDHLRTGEELRRGLAAKNRYNLRTMGLFLGVRWLESFVLLLLGLTLLNEDSPMRLVMIGLFPVLTFFFVAAYMILVERAIRHFRPLTPQLVSIYDANFWLYERLWKVPRTYVAFLNGTPFKSVVLRLLGARVGRRLFDDGAAVTEPTLVSIGDQCTLNLGALVQTHSQEDGTFKSDRSAIGDRCTIGVGALVHYGVTMGDGAVLAADSFLMKGEEVPPDARWGGNPATETRTPQFQQDRSLGSSCRGGRRQES